MIRSRRRRPRSLGLIAGCALLTGAPPVLSAQGLHAEIGRLWEADGWTTFRLGLDRTIVEPIGVALYGTHLRDESPVGRRYWGGGADLVLLRGRQSGPYAVGGLAGGFSSDSLDDWWHSWSAGGGYQLVLGGGLAIAGEARWRNVSPERRDGVELSLRLGALFGGRPAGSRRPVARSDDEVPPAPETTPDRTVPRQPPPLAQIDQSEADTSIVANASHAAQPAAAPADLAESVVATALDALGTEYRLGGTSTEGFDCSGLIQHAYAAHGIKLPRVSRDQAREGDAVARDLDALRPGDILTFSRRGGRITHVGLYLGDGRFVHSARRGVQVSTLSKEDPQGRWYWKRWVGARRIVSR